jgi:hypothetical protein
MRKIYPKNGTTSYLALIFFGQEPIELFVRKVVLFTSGLNLERMESKRRRRISLTLQLLYARERTHSS